MDPEEGLILQKEHQNNAEKLCFSQDSQNMEEKGTSYNAIDQPSHINLRSSMMERTLSAMYKLSGDRHFVLAAFFSLSFVNAWIWITWSPFVPDCAKIWNVSHADVDALSSVYMYIYIPFALLAFFGINEYGLKWGLHCASILNFVGAWFRYFGFENYSMVYTGTLLCGLAQTFILSMPSLLSGEWFGSTEQAIATSIGVLGNQLGIAIGLSESIFINGEGDKRNEILICVFAQLLVSLLAMFLVFCWIKESRPSSPPSLARISSFSIDPNSTALKDFFNIPPEFEEHVRSLILQQRVLVKNPTFVESINIFFSDASHVWFGIIYGIVVGVFYAICTFLSQYLTLSLVECGVLGALFIIIGCLGPVITGYLLDNSIGTHREITFYNVVGCLVSTIYMWVAIWLFPHSRIHIYSSILLNGILLTALISTGFEYCSAITFPADEGVVTAILNCFAQVFGWLLVYIGGSLSSVDGFQYNSILVGFVLVATILFATFVKTQSRRPRD